MSERTTIHDIGFGPSVLLWLALLAALTLLQDVTDDQFPQMGDAIACGIGGPRVCQAIEQNAASKKPPVKPKT